MMNWGNLDNELNILYEVFSNPDSVRMLNDKLMLLERVFLLPQGLPDRTIYKNAIFSPSKFNSYGEIQFNYNYKD